MDMSTSLIVRDATLAINGATHRESNPLEHVRARIEEARGLDAGTLGDCAEVLRASTGASGGDPEVLEALVVIALANPGLAEKYGLSPQVIGRRLAARLERMGGARRALAILTLLLESFPGNGALDREMASLMRRQGMVQDLADRYLERAQGFMAKGQDDEAIAWFREVLLLDRSRTDVARCIREIKQSRADSKRVSKGRTRLILISLLLSASSVAVVRREKGLHEAYQNLPVFSSADVDSLGRRLLQVEIFVDEHPLWHGSLKALSERKSLRTERQHREVNAHAEAERAALITPTLTANERADSARQSGI
ncbi:MAG: hypothetical protein ACI82F_001280, partial [Planctomycetota bacterium]